MPLTRESMCGFVRRRPLLCWLYRLSLQRKVQSRAGFAAGTAGACLPRAVLEAVVRVSQRPQPTMARPPRDLLLQLTRLLSKTRA